MQAARTDGGNDPVILFPFQVEPTIASPVDLSHPFQVSPETAWLWYHAKIVRFGLDINSSDPDGNASFTVDTQRLGRNATLPFADEKDLLFPGIGQPDLGTIGPCRFAFATGGSAAVSGNIEYFGPLSAGGGSVARDKLYSPTGDHLPMFEMDMVVTKSSTPVYQVKSYSSSGSAFADTGSFEGNAFPFWVSDAVFPVTGASLTVTILEYFPFGYGSAAVDQVRDSTTFAKIRQTYQVPV
jgi:hypothetical protein